MSPMSTITDAAVTFVAQNWGAGKKRIREAMRKVLAMEMGWGLFACALVYLAGEWIIRLTTGTDNPQILDNAVLSMRIHFPFFPVLGVLLCLRECMESMGQKIAPVVASIIELGMKALSAVWLIPHFGYLGVCITEPVTWVIMTAFLLVVYGLRTKRMLETGTPAIKKGSSMSRIANIKNNNQMDLQEKKPRECYTELAVEGGNGLPQNGDLKGDQHHEKK